VEKTGNVLVFCAQVSENVVELPYLEKKLGCSRQKLGRFQTPKYQLPVMTLF
jgi:hypothetical protein